MAEQIGEITILHGSASAEGPEGIRELTLGSPIFNDDIVSTDLKGSVEIQFTDGALLSQGPGSKVHLDDYVFDPDNDAGEITMSLIQGTFRSVTGQIVDMNPEGFQIETANTTIGIRGTTTGHVIGADGQEQHIVVDFVDKPVIIRPAAGGPIRIITQDGMGVTASASGIGSVQRASANALSNLEQLSSDSMKKSAPKMQDDEPDDGEDDEDNGNNGEPQDGGEGQEAQGEGGEEGGGEQEPQGDEVLPGPITEPIPQPIIPPPPPPPPPLTPPTPPPTPPITKPEPEREPESEPEPEPEPEPVVTSPILDLSAYGEALTVEMPNSPSGEYHPTADDTDTTEISEFYTGVIGATAYANDITGGPSDNLLIGGNEADNIVGGAGNDTIMGLDGPDVLDGGDGTADIVSYSNDSAGVSVQLWNNYGTDGGADSDQLLNFEGVFGSAYNDDIAGTTGDNSLFGDDGDDILYGQGGVDDLRGGAGNGQFKFTADAGAGTVIEIGRAHV